MTTEPPEKGRFEDAVIKLVLVTAAGLAVFQLWQSVTGSLAATVVRPVHLTWVMVLTFLHRKLGRSRAARAVDLLLVAVALYTGYVIATFDYRGIDHILNGLDRHHFIVGVLFIALLFEATRRSVGLIMTALAFTFLLYNAYGNLLPDLIANRGFTSERIIRFQIFTNAGLFGTPLGIAISTVFVFVVFGAFLEVTGAGKFFIDLAFAAAGRFRGGPAKATVLASAAMGSISGSAIANTVTTGSLTIPMMKRLGYRAEQAAGIEAAASTGGQVMPPIMGAGAFIMAEFTNTPYNDIVLISIAPALLYFVCTLLFVHLMALKRNLSAVTDSPPVATTLAAGFHFIVPLVLVTGLLLANYSPPLVGTIGCFAVVIAGALHPKTRVSWRLLYDGLARGALLALPISAACATAGIIVGVIGQTGIGLQFTETVVAVSSGELWLALFLIAIAALILGMGLPVTAAYIVIAVMAAPALEDLGLPLVAAHMVLFWLSQTSNVTPPIALAAFAGAGIAGASPMRSAVEAMKLAAGFFIVPLMMAYGSILFLEGVTFLDGAASVLFTLALIAWVAFAAEGYALGMLGSLERVAFGVAAAMVVYPGWTIRLVGVGVGAATFVTHAMRFRGLGAMSQPLADEED